MSVADADFASDLRHYATYEEAVAGFRWQLPERYNIAADVIESHRGDTRSALRAATAGRGVDVVSFDRLATSSACLAASLRELGLERGSRACTILPNGPEVAVAQLAVLRLGAIVAPLRQFDSLAPLGPELAAIAPRLVFCESESVPGLRAMLGDGAILVATDRGSLDTRGGKFAYAGRNLRHFGDLLAGPDPGPETEATIPDDPAFITFTSGSTGPSKAAVIPHRTVITALPSFQMFSSLGPRPGDVFFNSIGVSTLAGFRPVVLPAWHFGCPVVTPQRGADAHTCCELISDEKVTVAYLMPNMLRALRNLGDAIDNYDWSALRAIAFAGEAIGSELHEWLEQHMGAEVNPYYGATEAAYIASACPPWYHTPPGATGKLVPGREVIVLDERTLAPLPTNGIGIISVRRSDPGVFLGYIGPEPGGWNYGRAVIKDGYFLTNDLARVDANGMVWYIGRKGQVIHTSAGEVLSPTELEDVVLRTGLVVEVVAVHLEQTDGAELLVLCVTVASKADAEQLAGQITATVTKQYGSRLRLDRVVILRDIPRTAGTMKLNRKLLHEQLLAGQAETIASVEVA